MNWKIGLDKYLTNPPDDGYDNWCEMVCEKFSQEFWDENEEWTYSDLCSDWMQKLAYDNNSPEYVAKVIERAFRLYVRKRLK